MRDIFKSIDLIIEQNLRDGRNKRFKWTLPRQIGVTQYMLGRADDELLKGNSVLIVGPNHEYYREMQRYWNTKNPELHFNKELMYLTPSHNWNYMRGKMADVILIDSIGYINSSMTDEMMRVMNVLNPLIAQSIYTLHLETTEGDIY